MIAQRAPVGSWSKSTSPPSFTGNNTTFEIVVAASGRFVYASNRGHDSLAIFAIDDAVGTLSPVDWEPTQGKMPRFFAIEPSGAVLYAANTDWWRSASTRAVANSRRPARSS